MTAESAAPEPRPPFLHRVWAEITAAGRAILFFLPFFFVFTTTAFGNYSIPSESMVPTLEVGDRIVVNKWAYGYSRHSLPLGLGNFLPRSEHRWFERLPERGDVVVFIHPHTGRTMIKRLIGLPGDTIEVRDGVLHVNGAPVGRDNGERLVRRAHGQGEERFTRFEETLPNGVRHPIHELPMGSPLDDFGPVRVPENHFFFMGDNRDNSLDSRYGGMGPVPLENLVGRAETVYFAAWRCRGDDCPERDRWLRPLRD